MTAAISVKPSALDALRALSKKKPAPVGSSAANLVAESNDPAIAGAKRNKNTVTLGFDPAITDTARLGAELKEALDRATAEFAVQQAKLRDYGKAKRDKYNEAFKCVVTTVCVPFTVEVPACDGDATPGWEQKAVQVISSNRYSTSQDDVLRLEAELGPAFPRLFIKTEEKVLKPNAEELIRNLLTELGITGEELETSMSALIDTKVKVATAEAYEQEVRTMPADVQAVLSQAVVRVQPSIKF